MSIKFLVKIKRGEKGGSGSGNFGHAGRPGQVGGSGGSGGGRYSTISIGNINRVLKRAELPITQKGKVRRRTGGPTFTTSTQGLGATTFGDEFHVTWSASSRKGKAKKAEMLKAAEDAINAEGSFSAEVITDAGFTTVRVLPKGD